MTNPKVGPQKSGPSLEPPFIRSSCGSTSWRFSRKALDDTVPKRSLIFVSERPAARTCFASATRRSSMKPVSMRYPRMAHCAVVA